MEASVSKQGHELPASSARAQTVERRGSGQFIPLLFLSSVVAMYVVLGYAIYILIAALI